MSLAQRQAEVLERTSDIDRLGDIGVAKQHLNRGEIGRGGEPSPF